MMRRPLAVIVSGFPRRSETFAVNELLALDRHRLLGALFATQPGDGRRAHPGTRRLLDRVEILAPGDAKQQAAEVVERLRGRAVAGVHAYFSHHPAAVAAEAAGRLGVPYGFSVHASDARKADAAELAARASRAACIVACNRDVTRDLPSAARVVIVPHGVDLERFRAWPQARSRTFRILAVGRLVEKKGFQHLVAAVARLSMHRRLRIIGDGPLRPALAAQISETGLADIATIEPDVTHARLPSAYRWADVVVVPSVMDGRGDRDGLPNVVLEAMASGRPVIASDVGAIATAVVHGRTGWLVPPGDVDALVRALSGFVGGRALCRQLARLGRRSIEQHFELEACTARLCRVLRNAYA